MGSCLLDECVSSLFLLVISGLSRAQLDLGSMGRLWGDLLIYVVAGVFVGVVGYDLGEDVLRVNDSIIKENGSMNVFSFHFYFECTCL